MPTGHASLMPALRRVVLAGAGADRTDGQVLSAFVADRDADAFGLLVRRHGPMVLGVCRRVIGDHTTAEDAFQAVFLVLARRAAAVKPREQVGNWLYGVAYRTALKARAVLARRRGREKQVDVMPEPPSLPRTDDWADLQPVIDEELARLPEKLRGPVVLCDIEGRPQREVAKHLGVPPATLATRLATARRTLAQRLTKRGIALSGGALATLLTAHGTASAVSHTLTDSLSRAAESVAAGGAISTLVSAGAVQLSEGVLRMMLLNKLKAVAVAAVTALTLTTGVGLGLVPARGDEPGAGPGTAPALAQKEKAAPTKPAEPPTKAIDKAIEEKWRTLSAANEPAVDDATFLRRLSLDLRGTMPTDIETFFFVSDPEDAKRKKVVAWLLEDDGVQKAYAAKLLRVDEKRVRVVKVVDVGDEKVKSKAMVVVVDASGSVAAPQVQGLAFTPDGERLAVELHPAQGDVTGWRTAKVAEGQPLVVQLARDDAPLPVRGPFLTDDVIEVNGRAVRVFRAQTEPPAKGEAVKPQAGVWLYGQAAGPGHRVVTGKDGVVRVWDTATGKGIATVDFDLDGKLDTLFDTVDFVGVGESDLDFLKKATMAARGTAPTALEERYFTEDKDPKKREKLLDSLLKEPAVAKKLGDDFKKKMLAGGPGSGGATKEWKFMILPVDPKQGGKPGVFEFKLDGHPQMFVPGKPLNLKQGGKEGFFEFQIEGFKLDFPPLGDKTQPPAKKGVPVEGKSIELVLPVNPKTGAIEGAVIPAPPKPPVPPKPPATPATPQADKLEKLVASLLAAKKTDAEMLEAVTLATVGRLPTDTEKRLTLGLVGKSADRKAAWLEVAKALSGSSSDEPQRTEVRVRVIRDENEKPAVIVPAKP